VSGTCHTCYRYYCPSLITLFRQSVLPWILSAEPPSNNHNITELCQFNTSSLGNGIESEKKTLLSFSAPNYLHNDLLKYILHLWITLYYLGSTTPTTAHTWQVKNQGLKVRKCPAFRVHSLTPSLLVYLQKSNNKFINAGGGGMSVISSLTLVSPLVKVL
jgi:hypothetical protein